MKQFGKPSIYIWQRPDWPDFKWNQEIVDEVLNKAVHSHGILLGKMSTVGLYEKNKSILASLTDELVKSSEIEGEFLNAESVRSSIARKLGIKENNLLKEDYYVEGLVDVILDALGNCKKPLSAERIFEWHTCLFPYGKSGMYRITVGDWRKGPEAMQVVSGAMGFEKVHFEAPPSAQIDSLMNDFISWCNSTTLHPLIASAVSHLWFVTIHPFDDGNGRIARTISDYFVAKIEQNFSRFFSISSEINRNKKQYYNILEATQKGDLEVTEWICTFLTFIESAINRAIESFDVIIKKSVFWEKYHNIEINERQRKIINRLLDGFEGKLTSSKWAKICHCSQDTALRDINDLISKSLLSKTSEGGRSANYILNS